MTTALVRPARLSLDDFSRQSGLHPETTVRLVRLGLLDPTFDARGDPWFVRGDVIRAGRILRLRASLSVNYAALGLVLDLLDRIDTLEAALRRRSRPYGGTEH